MKFDRKGDPGSLNVKCYPDGITLEWLSPTGQLIASGSLPFAEARSLAALIFDALPDPTAGRPAERDPMERWAMLELEDPQTSV